MKTFFVCILLLTSPAYAQETMDNNFVIRAGLSFLSVFFKTGSLIDNAELAENEGEKDLDETRTFGYGFSTSIAYRWTNVEIGFGSDVYFGLIKDLTFSSDNKSIRGKGTFRVVNLSPRIKAYAPIDIFNKFHFYGGVGPNWSLQTFVFSDVAPGGGFDNKKRVSFENYGAQVFIGIEEIKSFKEDHPLFLEAGYSYMNSYRVSVLDASNNVDVVTLSERKSRKFSGHYLIVRMGTTLF